MCVKVGVGVGVREFINVLLFFPFVLATYFPDFFLTSVLS